MMREKLEALAKDWAADKDGIMSYAYKPLMSSEPFSPPNPIRE